MKESWKVPELVERVRLDVFLAENLPEMTRSQIQKALKTGAGLVNDKVASVHTWLKTNDQVIFETHEVERLAEQAAAPLLPLKVIDESKDFIVLDKQPGILVHPDVKTKHGTLVDMVLAHDPSVGKVGEDPERPGIVHRLDREVSGLMVVARSQKGYESLKEQFAKHTTEKTYVALVYGEIKQDEGDVKFRIGRSKTRGRMAARPEHEEGGKAAWTHFKVLERYRHATLLELQIISGRTHQIRAHMLALNHPIIGDTLYTRAALERNVTAPRLMLQCVHLAFIDPSSGEKKSYDLAPVPEFAQLSKLFS